MLDFVPENHPRRAALVEILKRLSGTLARYQDKETGLWYQVVDQGGRDRNYFEASASSMFVDAMAKGVRGGYLRGEFARSAGKAYEGLVRNLIKVGADGTVDLTNVCSVAGLGGPQERNGTFDYYVSEPVVANDLKGVGSFIMASVEMDPLGH